MDTLVVVTHPSDWPQDVPDVRAVTARSYLLDSEFSTLKRAKVFNLCRFYRYQTFGYYVSLVAEARGHKPIPTVITMQDLHSPALVRIASDDLEDKIQRSLKDLQSDHFILSIYFGHNVAKRHDRLAGALFKLFPSPFLRATFVRSQQWELQNITAIPLSAIPEGHQDFAFEAAQRFFSHPQRREQRPTPARFDLAILHGPEVETCPSNLQAVEKFAAAGADIGLAVEIIHREDYGRLLEFDALFIRATTAVNHYTYRFSRRAEAEGLVVMDDPKSILRCSNKVYLAELLARNGVPTPGTLVLHRSNLDQVAQEIGFPCILKKPDGSSSIGVLKVDDQKSLVREARQLFKGSDLLIAQKFVPTPFDWRIGVCDRRPLFAARYYMADRHWQIIRRDTDTGSVDYGNSDILPVEEVPAEGVKLALQAANLLGDGLYGVDLKQVDKQWYVIEVNDNPSIDAGVEDRFLKNELYRRVMGVFLRRIEERKEGRSPR